MVVGSAELLSLSAAGLARVVVAGSLLAAVAGLWSVIDLHSLDMSTIRHWIAVRCKNPRAQIWAKLYLTAGSQIRVLNTINAWRWAVLALLASPSNIRW